jgi:hypothetical protein
LDQVRADQGQPLSEVLLGEVLGQKDFTGFRINLPKRGLPVAPRALEKNPVMEYEALGVSLGIMGKSAKDPVFLILDGVAAARGGEEEKEEETRVRYALHFRKDAPS